MSFTRPYVLRISAIMATSANQQGVVGADSGAIWMWTEACVILRGYSPFKMTFCFVDLLRRHLFLSFYNTSPLLSTLFLISPACCDLVAQLVGRGLHADYPVESPSTQAPLSCRGVCSNWGTIRSRCGERYVLPKSFIALLQGVV